MSRTSKVQPQAAKQTTASLSWKDRLTP